MKVIEFLTNQTGSTDLREANVVVNVVNKGMIVDGILYNEGELSRYHMVVIAHLREMILDKHHDLAGRTFCYKICISLASTCFGRDSITRTAPVV